MKNKLTSVLFGLFIACVSAFGQTALTQTTASAAMTNSQNFIALTSATGVVANTELYILDPGREVGELVKVRSISSTTALIIRNGQNKVAHVSGALVLIGPSPTSPTAAQAFQTYNPQGACTAASTLYTPWVNATTGEQWLCSTITLSWVPGWNNDNTPSPTAAVASAAGVIVPSGPLFHVTGALAITGFTLPIGYNGGGFCVIPDGTFTTTAAGNIALASTAVVSKQLCWGYDPAAAKPFFPTY